MRHAAAIGILAALVLLLLFADRNAGADELLIDDVTNGRQVEAGSGRLGKDDGFTAEP